VALFRILARVAAALRPQVPAEQLVCLAAVPGADRIAGHPGGFQRPTRIGQVPADQDMQRPHRKVFLAMVEERRWAARLSAAEAPPLRLQAVLPVAASSHWEWEVGLALAAIRVDAVAWHRERRAGPKVHFRDDVPMANLAVQGHGKMGTLPVVPAAVRLAQALAGQEQEQEQL